MILILIHLLKKLCYYYGFHIFKNNKGLIKQEMIKINLLQLQINSLKWVPEIHSKWALILNSIFLSQLKLTRDVLALPVDLRFVTLDRKSATLWRKSFSLDFAADFVRFKVRKLSAFRGPIAGNMNRSREGGQQQLEFLFWIWIVECKIDCHKSKQNKRHTWHLSLNGCAWTGYFTIW